MMRLTTLLLSASLLSSALALPINVTLQSQICGILNAAVAAKKAPGLAAIVFTSSGTIAECYSGYANVDTKAPWTSSSVFWPASMGKAAVSYIALRAASEANIGLDDPTGLARVLPEFALGTGSMARQLIGWNATSGPRSPVTVATTVPVTLRLILSHTAGQGYEFDDPKTSIAFFPPDAGSIPSILSGDLRAINVPPVNVPGSKWLYGAQADWAGQFAIRVTGKTLRTLINDWIATPLGLLPDTFGSYLTPSMLNNLVAIHNKTAPGTFVSTPIVMPQYAGVPPAGFGTLASAPVYATMRSFATFLSTAFQSPPSLGIPSAVFNEAVADDIGKRGLSLPSNPVYVTTAPPESNTLQQYDATTAGTQNLGWSLLQTAVERQMSSTGRSPGTLSWTGLANSHHFVDRAKGIGMVVSASFLPFWDQDIVVLRDAVEKAIYGVA